MKERKIKRTDGEKERVLGKVPEKPQRENERCMRASREMGHRLMGDARC